MTASPRNLLILARQGNVQAIAALVNRQLQPKGITARAILDTGCLKLLLESVQEPPQQALVPFIHQCLLRLKPAGIRQIKIYGRKLGDTLPCWRQVIEIAVEENSVSPQAENSAPDTDPRRLHSSLTGGNGTKPKVLTIVAPGKNGSIKSLFPRIEGIKPQAHPQGVSATFPSEDQSPLFLSPSLLLSTLLIFFPIGLLLTWTYTQSFNLAGFKAILQSETTASDPPTSSLDSSLLQNATAKAITAAVQTQTADSAAEWQQVATLWKEAVSLLEQVPMGDPTYAIAQERRTEYQQNLAYARQQLQQLSAFGRGDSAVGLGISRQTIQTAFEQPQFGFQFDEFSPIDRQPRVLGKYQNDLVLVELIGAPANLSKVTLIVGLPDRETNLRDWNDTYMVELLHQVAPDWSGASSWLTQSVTQLAQGQVEEVVAEQNNRLIKLSAIREMGTLMLVIEPL